MPSTPTPFLAPRQRTLRTKPTSKQHVKPFSGRNSGPGTSYGPARNRASTVRTSCSVSFICCFESLQVIPPCVEIRVVRMTLSFLSKHPESVPVNVSLQTGKPRLGMIRLVLFVWIEVHFDRLLQARQAGEYLG